MVALSGELFLSRAKCCRLQAVRRSSIYLPLPGMTWWQLLQPSGHDRPQNDFLFKGSYTDCYRPLMGNVYNLHRSASVTRETNTLAMGNNSWSMNINVPFTKTTQYKGMNMDTPTKSLCSLLLLGFLAFNCKGKKRTYSGLSQKTIWILFTGEIWWVIIDELYASTLFIFVAQAMYVGQDG